MKLPENIKSIEEKMIREFNSEMFNLPAILTHTFADTVYEDDWVLIEVDVVMEWCNCKQSHSIRLVCFDVDRPDDYGIDFQTEHADIGSITASNIMTQLYFDLALKDISEEYLQ